MTVDLRRTRGRDLLTLRENTLDEDGSEEAETPKAQSPEEKYHH
jgi:hypothetical protein